LLENFTIKHNQKEIKNQTFIMLTIFLLTLIFLSMNQTYHHKTIFLFLTILTRHAHQLFSFSLNTTFLMKFMSIYHYFLYGTPYKFRSI